RPTLHRHARKTPHRVVSDIVRSAQRRVVFGHWRQPRAKPSFSLWLGCYLVQPSLAFVAAHPKPCRSVSLATITYWEPASWPINPRETISPLRRGGAKTAESKRSPDRGGYCAAP